jgi:threonine dehydrogenase-like Zn-dependent dehydrogenase
MRAVVIRALWQPRPGYEPTARERGRREARVGSRIWRTPTLQIEDVDPPRPGPDGVLVKVRACGVCGSDRHMVQTDPDGYTVYPGYTRFPVIMGHEFAGEVIEVGAEVTSLRAGDAVACDNMAWCGHCAACRAGSPNQCESLEEIGFTVPGGLAEYVGVPARCCWPIAPLLARWKDEDGFAVGALVEPTAVAYQGIFVEAGGPSDGAAVVYGAGPIGLASIALLRAAGARPILVFQRSVARRALAARLGADVVLGPDELRDRGVRARDVVMDLTGARGAAFQVEAAGALPETVPEMLASLAPRGTILLLGRSAHPASVFFDPLQSAAGRIVGSIGHAGERAFPGVIEMLGRGALDLLPMVTDRIALEEVPTVLCDGAGLSSGKILVTPQRGGGTT